MNRITKLGSAFDPETPKDKLAIVRVRKLLKDSKDALAKAAKVADKYKLSFDVEGPAYGMGGSYYPVLPTSVPIRPYRSEKEYLQMENDEIREHGWLASSQSC